MLLKGWLHTRVPKFTLISSLPEKKISFYQLPKFAPNIYLFLIFLGAKNPGKLLVQIFLPQNWPVLAHQPPRSHTRSKSQLETGTWGFCRATIGSWWFMAFLLDQHFWVPKIELRMQTYHGQNEDTFVSDFLHRSEKKADDKNHSGFIVRCEPVRCVFPGISGVLAT